MFCIFWPKPGKLWTKMSNVIFSALPALPAYASDHPKEPDQKHSQHLKYVFFSLSSFVLLNFCFI